MPEGYEKMKEAFERTMSTKSAKTKAAKIWNKEHPENPVRKEKK